MGPRGELVLILTWAWGAPRGLVPGPQPRALSLACCCPQPALGGEGHPAAVREGEGAPWSCAGHSLGGLVWSLAPCSPGTSRLVLLPWVVPDCVDTEPNGSAVGRSSELIYPGSATMAVCEALAQGRQRSLVTLNSPAKAGEASPFSSSQGPGQPMLMHPLRARPCASYCSGLSLTQTPYAVSDHELSVHST